MPLPAAAPRGWFASHLAPLAATIVFMLLAAYFCFDRLGYDALMATAGVPPIVYPGGGRPPGPEAPFFDTQFVLGVLECWRRGIDVYTVNPCDAIGRLQDYSPLWLRLGFIPARAALVVPFGIALTLLYVAALWLLPRRGLGLAGQGVLALAMISPAALYATERGNSDLLIFALCAISGRLLCRAMPSRAAGYVVVLAAAALKFYPLVLLIVALRERVRILLAVGAVSVVTVAAFVVQYGAETQRALANTYVGYFADSWGAASLPYGAAHIMMAAWPRYFASHPAWHAAISNAVPLTVLGLAVIAAATLAAQLAVQGEFARACAALPEATRTFLVIGAALAAGCFLAHQNFGYRAVLLVLEMPGLVVLARSAPTPQSRRLLWWNAAATVFLLWNAPGLLSSYALPGWMLRHCLWWGHITVSMAVLVRFGLDSPAWRALCRVATPVRVAG